jgi:cytochrome c-type biogenesis protein CcmE
VDLTPRPAGDAPAPPRPKRRWMPIGVLVLVLVAGGVLVAQFLGSAVDYYCNVDEVGHKSGCNAGRSMRVQGTVEEGTLQTNGGEVTFMLAFNGATLPVHLDKEPGGIFRECTPVVVHGRMGDDGVFDGTRVEVKHSNVYVDENKDRLDDAEARATACSPQA